MMFRARNTIQSNTVSRIYIKYNSCTYQRARVRQIVCARVRFSSSDLEKNQREREPTRIKSSKQRIESEKKNIERGRVVQMLHK